MKLYSDCPLFLQGLISFLFFILCLVFGYILYLNINHKRSIKNNIFVSVILVINLLMTEFSCCLYFKRTELRRYHYMYLNTPVIIHIAFLSAFTTIVFLLIIDNYKWYTTHVSRITIKDGFDNLPTGICVYNKDGLTSLINKKMDLICQEIVGKPLQSGLIFWDKISKGKVKPSCKMLQHGDSPIIQLPNGEIYMFTKKVINSNSIAYYEINCTDITEEYSKTIQLSENNQELQKINERLREYGEYVTEATREQEILTAKMRIHDTFNILLLYTKHCIENDITPEEKTKLIKLWQGNILMLCKNENFADSRSPLKELTDAAESIGIQLNIKGDVPKDKQLFHVFLLTAIECLTNSVKHAAATELFIECSDNKIRFYDNSDIEIKNFTLGGGLNSVKKSIADSGGTMEIETTPRFCVTIFFKGSEL